MEISKEALVEHRSNTKRVEWCVIYDGEVYPFGNDDFGKELAQWAANRLESGKDTFRKDPTFTHSVI